MVIHIHVIDIRLISNNWSIGNIIRTTDTCYENTTITRVDLCHDTDILNEIIVERLHIREATGYSVTHVDCFTREERVCDNTESFTVCDGCTLLSGS